MKIFATVLFAAALFALGSSFSVAEQVAAGEPAPDFELVDQDGQLHSIEDYRGKWIALYFYPKDGTPGCTTEACEFRDNIFAFRDANCQILGVSLDDEESHKAFSEKHGLPFPLLADTKGLAADAYGVKTNLMGMKLAKRQTFLINPEGNIAKHYVEVNPKSHSAEILADLATLSSE
ncbi:MAG: peroxiredoxin [Proteobacteria bacterium]|nr:peroxiredoxin [Pseudomonadota bacterium]MDA0992844.1 peroxiredoxin [Pseudomonadota bacterium]